jgi:hypothetical protein
MNGNIVSVRLWEREVAKLEWRGGYKKKFGKLGKNYTAQHYTP